MKIHDLSAQHIFPSKRYTTYECRPELVLTVPSARTTIVKTRRSADADNRLDAFSGQSRSTNMVPFHMLHIVSYCAIVTLSLRPAVFTIFVFKKFHDLEMGSKVTQCH